MSTVAFLLSFTLLLNAQSTATAKPAGHEARIQRIEATAVDLSMASTNHPCVSACKN